MNPSNAVQYIGQKEILTLHVLPDKTPLDGKIYEVTYTDGSMEVLTEKTFKNSVTNEPVDLSKLRELRVEPLAKEILVLMRESNIKIDEVDYLMTLVAESINYNTNAANNKLWKVSSAGEVTFLMQDNILKDNDGTGDSEAKE